MSAAGAKIWLQRGAFAFAGLTVAVNLGFALAGKPWSAADSIQSEAATILPADATAKMPFSSDAPATGPAAASPTSDVADAVLRRFGQLEPAAGDAEPPGPEIAQGTPEYSGDGETPREPRGLGLPDIQISKMETFERLNDVIELLRQRRQYLVEQEDRVAFRERVLSQREQALADGLERLERLRVEIDGLIDQKSDDEERELARLVKVYENMKAKSAAEIFNSLDMTVLMDVARRMREAKFAVILQNMDPKRAEALTEKLAEQAQLPEEVRPTPP